MTKHKRRKQDWTIGNVVKVGFVENLEVIKVTPTPGDGAPDIYVLWQSKTGRFYTFQPHLGLVRHPDLAEALAQ